MMHEFDSTEIAVVVAKNTQQELVPKMVQKGQEDSKYPLQVNTPVVSVQYSDMKKGGDKKNLAERKKKSKELPGKQGGKKKSLAEKRKKLVTLSEDDDADLD